MRKVTTLGVLCVALSMSLSAQSQAGRAGNNAPAPAAASSNTDDLKSLRDSIAKQQEEIQKLEDSLQKQQAQLEQALKAQQQQQQQQTATAQDSTAPSQSQDGKLVPVSNMTRTSMRSGQHPETQPSPLSIAIGNSTFTPLGFVDATFYGRTTNLGSGIGTNFAAIPYGTSATAHIGENNFSTQNSRVGFRVDSSVLGAKVLGYFEADFLGNQPTNVFVTSNSDTFRMRNVFVDVRKNGWEILGGQDWSFATPNRKGLSPLPSDIFYTQNMDTNYQAGLVWARQTQFRFIAHPSDNFAIGVSLENPQQYIGGSSGSPTVTLPSAFSALAGTQINSGSSSYSAANPRPDIIAKAAWDAHAGEKLFHIEAVGITRDFKIATPVTGQTGVFTTNSKNTAAGEVNTNLEVAKGFRLIANTFFGDGNGRYLFGQAPDFIVRADGTVSPIHSYGTVDGFELNLGKNTLFDAYYGGIYIDRDVTWDTTATKPGYVGYGYATSTVATAQAQNKSIQELTFGLTQTFWKSSNYGALSLITQYSYLTRAPWTFVSGSPNNTHTNMYWVDLRYTLP